MSLIIHIDNICHEIILKMKVYEQTFGNDIKIRFLWRTAVVSSYVHKEWLRRAVALSKDRSETCFTQWVLPASQLSQWKSKKWKLEIKRFNNNFIMKTKTIEDWKSKLKLEKSIFLNAAFCGFEIYNHCNARQLKMGAEIFCQFWFSVWVSDLDLRRDQIENANFVHLTLFVIYWEMCTNSISGHHLQMA